MTLSSEALFSLNPRAARRLRLSAACVAVGLMLAACGGGGGGGGGDAASSSTDVKGTVAGLTVDGLVLTNGTDEVTVSANAAGFSVSPSGTLSVARQPLGFTQACEVSGTRESPVVTCGAAVAKVAGGAGMSIPGLQSSNLNLFTVASDGTFRVVTLNTLSSLSATGGYQVVAGNNNGFSTQTGTGTAASLGNVIDVVTDGRGNTYVLDQLESKLLKVSATGVVTDTAFPFVDTTRGSYNRLAADAAGNVYVAEAGDNSAVSGRITRVSTSGTFSVVYDAAGITLNGTPFQVNEFAVSANGTIYFYSNPATSVYRVDGVTQATLLAGSGDGTFGNQGGTGSAALLGQVVSMAADANGVLYLADQAGSLIRRVDTAGTVTNVAGASKQYGSQDGTGSQARFNYISKVALDPSGATLYVTTGDPGMRKLGSLGVADGGVVTTFLSPETFVDGPKGYAAIDNPSALAVGADGSLYVADTNFQAVRKVNPDGTVVSLAGRRDINVASMNNFQNGNGDAATFSSDIRGLAVDASGTVYVADGGNCAVRKISPSRDVTTLVGANGCGYVNGAANVAQLGNMGGMAMDSQGNLLVSDLDSGTIRKITPQGVVSAFAGIPSGSAVVDGGVGVGSFETPWGLAVDAAGTVYVTEYYKHVVRKVTSDGVISTIAGEIDTPGSADGPAASARFYYPRGIAVDAAGNLYVADTDNALLRQIRTDGTVRTLVGQPGNFTPVDGLGTDASFGYPVAVALTPGGTLWVGDNGKRSVRRVESVKAVIR